MRARRQWQGGILLSSPRYGQERRRRLGANDFQRTKNLKLLDVLSQVPRRHAFVNVLMAG